MPLNPYWANMVPPSLPSWSWFPPFSCSKWQHPGMRKLTFSMGENKDFFHWAGKVHPKHNTLPTPCGFTPSSLSPISSPALFDMLADLFVFVTWIFTALPWGLIILRKNTQTAQDPTQSNCTLPYRSSLSFSLYSTPLSPSTMTS